MNYNTIKTFFEDLNEQLGVNCFVSGTYVFEGDDVFKFLKIF
jgi:pentose-5-phosphate-3-epimerase